MENEDAVWIVVPTDNSIELKAKPTSEEDKETIPTLWVVRDTGFSEFPERKVTPVAEREVPIRFGEPVLAADKRTVLKV
jgi:hypothetical protein